MALTSLSPAKINLFLHVIGKREDGYHNLQSVFVKLKDLSDHLTIEPNEEVICFTPGYEIEDNIVTKIALALKERYQIKQGAKITIHKNVPIGGGLGGGSSNAATALYLLCELWKIKMDQKELINFSAKFGADIPFFIDPSTIAFVEGIGEIITPVKLNKDFIIVLVNPRIGVNTKQAFQQGFKAFSKDVSLNDTPSLLKLIYKSRNDLEANAIVQQPIIKEVLDTISKQAGCKIARMSGSGSTCFGLFENNEDAENALKLLAKKWWVHLENLKL